MTPVVGSVPFCPVVVACRCRVCYNGNGNDKTTAGWLSLVNLAGVRKDPEVRALISGAEEHLKVLGYTEHGFRHALIVATTARRVLSSLEWSERDGELAAVAGFMHDIGNVVGRPGHGATGATIAIGTLQRMGMDPVETVKVAGAIGSHEDGEARPVNPYGAALILADKADVRRSRVRNDIVDEFDIHDRVNYAVTRRRLTISPGDRVVGLHLTVDTKISPVMEYFETFLVRMVMCRRAAAFLDCRFKLSINDTRLL